MARVEDFKTITPANTKKSKAQRRSPKTSAKKGRSLRQSPALKANKTKVKTVTVSIAGITYYGWYWADENRICVTYHELTEDNQLNFPCGIPPDPTTRPSK